MKKIILSALALVGVVAMMPAEVSAQFYVYKDGKPVYVERSGMPDSVTMQKPEDKYLEDGVRKIARAWSWNTEATDGVVWGNMGYCGGNGANVYTSGTGKWWGVNSESGDPNNSSFDEQLAHSVSGKMTGEESMDAYMVFSEDGIIKKYDKNGKLLNETEYSIETQPDESRAEWAPYILRTGENSVLWPFEINGGGKYVTTFEVVYLTEEAMTLVYPDRGDFGSLGGWGEASFWQFKAVDKEVDNTQMRTNFYFWKDKKLVKRVGSTDNVVDIVMQAPEENYESIDGHEYVDLGLSVKWARCNIGASFPEQSGEYYAWGETEVKEDYSHSTYKYGTFIGDNKTTLDPEDDAAHVNWGGDWVMPSPDDFDELEKNCTCEWTTQNGVNGYLIKGTNGNSIFLPAAGCRYYVLFYGSYGYYWSSSLYGNDSSSGRGLYFDEGYFSPWSGNSRCYGFSVRPVCPSAGNTNGHVAVDLGLPSGKLWAECNVGASTPEAGGDYFAWGETEAKENYDWGTYKYMQEGKSEWNSVNKYQVQDGQYGDIWYRLEKYSYDDNKTTLEKADDAATSNWGDNWRIPTAGEWEELYNNTTRTWTNDYEGTGVNGCILTSTKEGHEGASIFLPADGYRDDGGLSGKGSGGYYWLSSLGKSNSGYGRYLYFLFDGNIRLGDYNRYYGLSVRPVCTK